MMTGMARLIAAIKGEKADRIPIFCNLFDQGARELGVSIQEYYTRGEYVAEAQIRMREKYGYDNVWNLFYVGREAELLGCRKILYASDGPPNVGEFVIKSHEDIARLQVPDSITDHPVFQESLKCMRILRDEVGGKYPICVYLTAGMTLPALLMGMDSWFELLFLGPPAVRDELLGKCSDFFRKELAAYRAAGADVFIYANPFGSTDFVSLKQFDELAMPWMARDLDGVDTSGLVYYCGSARFNRVIDRVIRRLGLGAFYLSPLDDIAEGKRNVAGRGLTCGVINDIMLLHWSPEKIRQEVKRLIEAGKEGGHFLFGTLVMPYDIPDASIRAMIEAACEYGAWAGSDSA